MLQHKKTVSYDPNPIYQSSLAMLVNGYSGGFHPGNIGINSYNGIQTGDMPYASPEGKNAIRAFNITEQDLEKLYGVIRQGKVYSSANQAMPTSLNELMKYLSGEARAAPLYMGPPLYGPNGMSQGPKFMHDGKNGIGADYSGKGISQASGAKGGSGASAAGK